MTQTGPPREGGWPRRRALGRRAFRPAAHTRRTAGSERSRRRHRRRGQGRTSGVAPSVAAGPRTSYRRRCGRAYGGSRPDATGSTSALGHPLSSGWEKVLIRESRERALANVARDMRNVGARGRKSLDLEPDGVPVDVGDVHVQLHVVDSLVRSLDRDAASVVERALDVDRQPDAHDLATVAAGMIDDDVTDHRQVRHEDLASLVRHERRVAESDLLHDPRVLVAAVHVDGDTVADPKRLR